jgi:hypothetical protein
MRRSVIDKIGYFDPSYHYSMDIEYYTRAALKGSITQHITDQCLAAWRWHPDAKSFQKGIAYAFRDDEIRIAETYMQFLSVSDQKRLETELVEQRRSVLLRKAMWHHNAGMPAEAKAFLWEALCSCPSFIISRPWLGAARRIMTGAGRKS